MNSYEFKTTFGKIAKTYCFERAFGGWFKESDECIAVLDLQKSNYGNYYELNIKIYVQGAFGNNYRRNKELVKKDVGDVFTRQPDSFNDLFNLENTLTIEIRTKKLKDLFEQFIEPFVTRALSLQGLSEMESSGTAYLLPAVRDEITRLSNP